MASAHNNSIVLPGAIWSACGVGALGFVLIAVAFVELNHLGPGDTSDLEYPVVPTHGVLAGIVAALLLVGWAVRQPGAFRSILALPLAVALLYLGTVATLLALVVP